MNFLITLIYVPWYVLGMFTGKIISDIRDRL
jgi:hypothetical protein